jgi:hypothetical protein
MRLENRILAERLVILKRKYSRIRLPFSTTFAGSSFYCGGLNETEY